jgi:sugar phosphate isomerase/epimerase
MHIPLGVSYKGKYPFKLGVTSFIYEDTYLINANLLAPYFDEIELLIFESTDLLSQADVEELGRIGQEFNLSYNVHLPTDVSLTDDDPAKRKEAAKMIHKVISLTSPLSPSTFTLHLPDKKQDAVKYWQEKARDGVSQLMSYGIDSRKISVETLRYPFEWAEGIVEEFDLSVCMDIGHLFKYGFDAKAVFERYFSRISIIHLHGVKNGKDHIALDNLSSEHAEIAANILNSFKGFVSLEIFSYQDLIRSLNSLENQIAAKIP